MISDSLKNIGLYQLSFPHSNRIMDYLDTTDLSSLELGRHEISTESVFILVQEYFTKAEGEKKWESHRKYIDIQIVVSGEEYIGHCPTVLLKSKDGYNDDKDITLYGDDSTEHSKLLVPQNHFCMFFPQDGHKPGINVSGESAVRKAVIKVALR